ncbi:hypothetical protein AR539_17240 [Arthrobacter sp. EPSL27]|nr:hypothetical protein AR539_17240 [Arthrobacter sp. EPSL27]
MGKTGRSVSVVGLGTWQLGADWGKVDPAQARAVLAACVDAGVTFFDTADVYGDGRWIAAQDGVSTVIPGARSVDQARANAEAAGVRGIDATFDVGVREIYDKYFRASIHPRW